MKGLMYAIQPLTYFVLPLLEKFQLILVYYLLYFSLLF